MSPNVPHLYVISWAELVNTMEHVSHDSVILYGKGDFAYLTKALELVGVEKFLRNIKKYLSLDCLEQTVSWNIYFTHATSEVSERHEKHEQEILNHLRESLNHWVDCW